MKTLNMLVLSCTSIPISLDFMPLLPRSLVNLQLDHLKFSPQGYITYLKPLGNQLDKLAITSASQLTSFNLVNILQHFWKLNKLDPRNTEYLGPGTVGTIMRFCYNLQTFYFSPTFRFRDSRTWIDLAEFDYEYVEFHQSFHDMLETHKLIVEMDIEMDNNKYTC